MTPPVSETVASPVSTALTPAYPSVTPQDLTAWVDQRLHRHQEAVRRAVDSTPRTLDTTLRAYDDAIAELGLSGSQTGLMHSVCPDKAVRDAAEGLLQRISQAGVELSLNRDVYQALAAIDASAADAATKHYLDRTQLQ